MSSLRFDGKCKRLETVIYDSFLLGIVTTEKYIYTTDWVESDKTFYIWKTNKETGRNYLQFTEKAQPQGIGYFANQYGGKNLV